MPRIDLEEEEEGGEEEEEPAAGGSSKKIFSPTVCVSDTEISGVHARDPTEKERERMHALRLLTRKCVRGNGFRIIENGDDSVDGRQKVAVGREKDATRTNDGSKSNFSTN